MYFEALNQRVVVVVVDPIQSMKGKVVIDARLCLPPLGKAREGTLEVGAPNTFRSVVGEG